MTKIIGKSIKASCSADVSLGDVMPVVSSEVRSSKSEEIEVTKVDSHTAYLILPDEFRGSFFNSLPPEEQDKIPVDFINSLPTNDNPEMLGETFSSHTSE